jgi:peptide methionine sulfoxide reductase
VKFSFNLHAYSKAQLALSSLLKWPLPRQPMPKSWWSMRKVCRSSLVKCKSKFLFLSLPHCLDFILGVAFCPQAQSDQANVACFAGGCFWCTEAVFEHARGVTSVVSGYMQGAETIQITFDPSKTSYDKLLNLCWRAHNPNLAHEKH